MTDSVATSGDLTLLLGGGLRPPSEPPPGMAPAEPALEPVERQ